MKTFISTLMAILLWGAFPSSSAEAGKKVDCTPGAFSGAFDGEVTVCQGWNSKQQQEFWFTSQGSNIIPYGWFLNLEQANSAKLFRDSENVNSYRYLPQGETDMNPDALPIGFTKDVAKGNEKHRKISQEWLGITCAACHTGQLEYGGRKVLIDGAPAMADFQSFFEDMTTAMRATLNNPEKFKKFAGEVIKYNKKKNTGSTTDENSLKEHLVTVTETLEKRNAWNSGSIRFGNARLDALGSIFNQVLVAHELPLKEGLVNAPVSYPFIWDTPQLDKVQWNGSVTNAGLGAVGRNIGEVIGVFGSLKPKRGYQNSVNIANLGLLEELVWSLESPQWKDVWEDTDVSKIDPYLTDVGERVYAKKCKGCHALPINLSEREFEIKATMISIGYVGTDPTAAVNFASRGKSIGKILKKSVGAVLLHGFLDNKIEMIKTIKAGQPIAVKKIINDLEEEIWKGHEEAGSDKKRSMSEEFLGKLNAAIDAREMKILEKRKQEQQQKMLKLKERNPKLWKKLTAILEEEKCYPPLCYKARPLNGVWATAPYLHNGSVRTIRQLLVPRERQEKFNVGSRDYDPKNMGFKDAGNFVMNTTLPGNLNNGHDYYGIYFEDHKVSLKALMEYLKTL